MKFKYMRKWKPLRRSINLMLNKNPKNSPKTPMAYLSLITSYLRKNIDIYFFTSISNDEDIRIDVDLEVA